MIEWVLDPVVALNLRHSEFLWQGTGIDGYSERRVGSVYQIVKVAGDSSLKAVYHNLHLFLYCLHLWKIGGGTVSMREGMLKFCRSGLLGLLLPSSLSGPPRSKLSPWFSS